MKTHLFQRETQRSGMWLFLRGVVGAYPRRKEARDPEVAQLRSDAIAVAAGDQSKPMVTPDLRQHTARARYQLGLVVGVLLAPGEGGGVPASARWLCGAVGGGPIRRVG